MRVVAALLALVVVAGCGGDPQPKEPKSSTPTSASTTPTVIVPTMPAQAKKNTPEGAAAFVKHYIDVFNYASNTGDVTELSRLSSPNCDGCQRYIKLYRDTYAAGGYFKGGAWSAGPMTLEFGPPETYVTTIVTSPTGRFRLSRHSGEKASNPSRTKLTYAVSRRSSQWSVTQLALGGAK